MARGTTATKPAAVDEAEEPQSIFEEVSVPTKAGTYRFREIDGDTYDKCVEFATNPESKMVNTVQLLRWLAVKSAIGDNALTMEELGKLPFHARNKVLTEVNSLYFPDDVQQLIDELERRGYTVTPPDAGEEPEPGNS